jgi:tRNA-dihydrouridine synthase B
VRVARKHISWYSKGKGLAGGAAFRHAVNQVETAAAQLVMVREFFDRHADTDRIAA